MQLSKNDKIYVAGHRGLVGSAIVESLKARGYDKIVTRTRSELDLLDAVAVQRFYAEEKPDVVFVAAAKVGGIHANNVYRADFIYENLVIQNNVIWNAHLSGVHRLVFLGSSCIYPRNAPQPMPETCLLTGELEYTNRPYAIAKIAGLELVNSLRLQYGRDYFSVMPTNLYGPGDNFHPENSHVLPALIRRFVEAKESGAKSVTVWGTGKPRREFMYSLDCADAIVHLAESIALGSLEDSPQGQKGFYHINVGTGEDISIEELTRIIADAVGFTGLVVFDTEKPDGTPMKLLDVSHLRNTRWKRFRSLQLGIIETLKWYVVKKTWNL